MSLLLNEEFSVYTLRHAYLTNIHDGVGERLINLNTAVLNNPAFRAAGWLPDNAAIRRCYSPPIPTTSAAVGAEYFQRPRNRYNHRLTSDDHDDGQKDGENELARGMVTGERGSEDTIGLTDLRSHERKIRRTRKEQLDEDDSSDLSDEDSDSETEKERSAAQSIKFSKMPIRGTSKNSVPMSRLQGDDGYEDDEEEAQGPQVMVTSPSKPPENGNLQFRPRGSSLSAQVETVKQRARRDTTTSSDLSSELELDPNRSALNRNITGRPDQRPQKTVLLAERISEEDHQDLRRPHDGLGDSDLEDEDVDEASDLSDEFEAAVDSESLDLDMMNLGLDVGRASDDPSPLKPAPPGGVPPPIGPTQNQGSSPRKKGADKEDSLPKLPKLPPGRPISRPPPSSLISMALRGDSNGQTATGEKPFQRYADLSGKSESNPLWIKIYAPFSKTPTDAIEVAIRRTREGNPVTVSELIGLALWRYNEEEYHPPLTADPRDSNINCWDLRIVEDEEVDFDFPALVRTRPVTDFTSNNNRPPQRRARTKPWDEFGLVRATKQQFKQNEAMTPQIGGTSTPTPQQNEQTRPRPDPAVRSDTQTSVVSVNAPTFSSSRNPITGPSFAPSALRKDTGNQALDAPQRETAQFTPRTGAAKTVTVHFTDPQSFASTNITVPTTADTYIAEIFDHSCQKLGQEKGLYVLKVSGTQTVAPLDRTVEALGTHLHLDLVRRRFIGAGDAIFGLGLSGSPGSSSPNQPLELADPGTPGGSSGKKTRKGFTMTSQPAPSTATSSNLNLVGLGLALPPELGGIGGKKYNVIRKQPLSFSQSHPRTLIITPEYMQILPAAPHSLVAPTGKVTNVPISSIVGVKVSRKHPKMVRVLVYREKEQKRYDFEAGTPEEAVAIMSDIRKAIDGGKGGI